MRMLNDLVKSGTVTVDQIFSTEERTESKILAKLVGEVPEIKTLVAETAANVLSRIDLKNMTSKEIKSTTVEVRELLDVIDAFADQYPKLEEATDKPDPIMEAAISQPIY